MTTKEAKEIIKLHGKNTAFFNQENRYNLFGEEIPSDYYAMVKMFHEKGFGYSEAKCLTAALKIAGANIQG